MASRLNPYISFADNARQAMEFYKEVFGGTLTISTFGEYGMEGAESDKIMHSQLESDGGFTLMCADTPPGMQRTEGNNITVSLSGDDSGELHGYWDKLSEAARSRSRWRSRCGATSSVSASTSSASAGWSTSASPRSDQRARTWSGEPGRLAREPYTRPHGSAGHDQPRRAGRHLAAARRGDDWRASLAWLDAMAHHSQRPPGDDGRDACVRVHRIRRRRLVHCLAGARWSPGS